MDVYQRYGSSTLYRVLKTSYRSTVGMTYGMAMGMLGPSIPEFCGRQGVSMEQISWVLGSSYIFMTFASLGQGVLLDRVLGYSKHDSFLSAICLVMAITSVIKAWTTSFWWFAVAQITESMAYTGMEIVIDAGMFSLWGKKADPGIQTWHFTWTAGYAIGPLIVRAFLVDNTMAPAATLDRTRNSSIDLFNRPGTAVLSTGTSVDNRGDVVDFAVSYDNALNVTTVEDDFAGAVLPYTIMASTLIVAAVTNVYYICHERFNARLNITKPNGVTVETPSNRVKVESPSNKVKVDSSSNRVKVVETPQNRVKVVETLQHRVKVESPPNIAKETTHSNNAKQDSRWFVITMCVFFVIFYFCVGGIELLFHTWVYSFAMASQLDFTKSEAALLDASTKITMCLAKLITAPLSYYVPVQVILMLSVLGTLVCYIPLALIGTHSKLHLWVLCCLVNVCFAPLWGAGKGWMDKYVEVTPTILGLIYIGVGASGMILHVSTGYIMTHAEPIMLIYILLATCALLTASVVIMQVIASCHGNRFTRMQQVVQVDNDDIEEKEDNNEMEMKPMLTDTDNE